MIMISFLQHCYTGKYCYTEAFCELQCIKTWSSLAHQNPSTSPILCLALSLYDNSKHEELFDLGLGWLLSHSLEP